MGQGFGKMFPRDTGFSVSCPQTLEVLLCGGVYVGIEVVINIRSRSWFSWNDGKGFR